MNIPVRTVRDWRRRRIGPRWTKLEGTGRLYIAVIEVRRFLRTTTNTHRQTPTDRSQPEDKTS